MGAPQNSVSISRRPPDIEDYIDMLRRYRSWIIGPMFAGLVISVVVAFAWPDTFISTAVMRITPQQVSSRLVPTDVTQQVTERLGQMEQEILSRGNLTDLIMRPSLNLYEKERRQKTLEEIVQDMRTRAIVIRVMDMPTTAGSDKRATAAFAISFRYTDKFKAQKVVSELVTKFTEQNIQVLRKAAHLTSEFLDDEYKGALERLNDLQTKITKFQIENQGRLPEQFQANVAAEASAQVEANRLSEAISEMQSRKILMEQGLSNLMDEQKFWASRSEETLTTPGQASVKNQQLINTEGALAKLKSDLASVRKIYGEAYPDVHTLQAQIEVYEKQKLDLEKAQLEQDANTPKSGTVKITNPQVLARLEELKNNINSAKAQINNLQMQIERQMVQAGELNKRIAAFQARIEQAPLNAQQYNSLMRDYALAKDQYDSMVKARHTSETAKDLEEHKAGENLEVLDPPSLPEQPVEPNRPAWAAIGTSLGLFIGVMLAAAKEMKDASLKNLKDVRAYTNLPVLSSIPLLENALLVRRKRRLFWLAWSTAFIVGTIAMCGSLYYHYFGRA